MRSVYLATRTKNALHSYDNNLVVSLRNISVNGAKHGCSGFIQNPATGLTIYLTTEDNHLVCRYAKNTHDYVGGRNRWADTFEELVMNAVSLLEGRVADVG